MFTGHVCNDFYKSIDDATLNPGQMQKLYCEVWNDEGLETKLEVRRRLVMLDGEPAGVVGISRCISSFPDFVEPPKPVPMDCMEFFARLSIGEVEVIKLVIDGQLNKTIAKKLGVAIRTVESRRSKAMSKLGVTTVPDLVKLWCSFQNRN